MRIARRNFLAAGAALAGLSAAGCAGGPAPASARRVTVVDTHAHWYPAQWVSLLAKQGPANGAKVGREASGAVSFEGPGTPVLFSQADVDLDYRSRRMREQGVDVHALCLSAPMVDWAPAAFGLKLSQVFNDACSAAHLDYPGRFYGLAALPMQAPDLAVKELERAARLRGMRGVYMAPLVNGRSLGDPAFRPVFAKCAELGWPVLLDERIGEPSDAVAAASALVSGGVMDAFPRLAVMLPRAGSPRPPQPYLRRFYYRVDARDGAAIADAVRAAGADRVALGGSYPAASRPAQAIEQVPGLSRDERDFLLGGTAAKLLAL